MIYLDHNSTTRLSSSVRSVILNAQLTQWGNPHSMHALGIKAAIEINKAENIIKKHINGMNGKIIWTSSGSHANHLAITGICKKPGDLITSYLEHKSIDSIRKKYGNAVATLSDGKIDTSELAERNYIQDHIKLISFIYINNETGLENPIQTIKPLLDGYSTYFHTDAVQALGKVDIDVQKLGCDLMTLSAHKIYGPKGIGCLWVKDGVKINIPYLGTPNVCAIIGFGESVKNINVLSYRIELQKKEEHFLSELKKTKISFKINTTFDKKIPGTLSLSFPGINNIDLVLELSMKNTYVSTGSACNEHKIDSRILEELQLPKEQIDSTIRVSFGKHCSIEEITSSVQIISDTIKEIKNEFTSSS